MRDNGYFLSKLESLGFIPHSPEKPLYKYTTVETFKIILSTNKLRFSNPSIFNDPFEFSEDCFEYDMGENTVNDLVMHFAETTKSKDILQYLSMHKIELVSNEAYINYCKRNIEQQKRSALVFCTSMSPVIPLMWSHYSYNHQGVCFGINIPYDTEDSKEMIVTKSVVYDSIVKCHNLLAKDSDQTVIGFYNWVFGKSNVWEYEKEMRTFVSKVDISPNISYEDRIFRKEDLVEICYGLHTSQKDIDEIERLLKENGYNNVLKRYKIAKIKGTYNIEKILIS